MSLDQDCLDAQALAASQQRNAELEGLLSDARLEFACADKHRKSAQKQLDAQEEEFDKLGQRLKVSLPFLLPSHCPSHLL